jgi:predicted ABC-class ATPase
MTSDPAALDQLLSSLDGRGYGSYRQLSGAHELGPCRLVIDHVQADPYAPPSLMRLIVDRAAAGFPEDLLADCHGLVATTDFVARRLAEAASRSEERISVGAPGQEVLERTTVAVTAEGIEARLAAELPAAGRRIRGRRAARLLTEDLPRIAEEALFHARLDAAALRAHVVLHRDQEALREQLAGRGLVAFVGDGAILPRRAGDSDLPLTEGAVPFTSPESLRVEFALPSGRRVSGMGVPEGVTVIVGGGYHGASIRTSRATAASGSSPAPTSRRCAPRTAARWPAWTSPRSSAACPRGPTPGASPPRTPRARPRRPHRWSRRSTPAPRRC